MSTRSSSTQSNSKRRTSNVLAVGDCNTCGITVPPVGNTILDKFCRLLKQQGYDTSSQNLGYGMACSREGIELMRQRAKPADVVLINFGLVDTWITSIPQYYIPYFPETPIRKRLRKLLKFIKRRLRSPRLRRFIPLGPVVPIDEYAQNIREMIAIARAKNPRATILLWGSPPVQHDDQRNANLSRYNQRLKGLAIETNAFYVSTEAAITNLSEQQAYVDEVHLNEDATAAIASLLAIVFRSVQLSAAG